MRHHSCYVDIKQAVGGLVDIEFLVQYLVLRYSHQFNDVANYSDNLRILAQLQALAVLDEETYQQLSHCYVELRDLGHRATLQNEVAIIDEVMSQNMQQIARIYQQFLP